MSDRNDYWVGAYYVAFFAASLALGSWNWRPLLGGVGFICGMTICEFLLGPAIDRLFHKRTTSFD